MVYYNDCFKKYTSDNKHIPPDKKYLNKKRLIKKYFKAYKDLYHYQ